MVTRFVVPFNILFSRLIKLINNVCFFKTNYPHRYVFLKCFKLLLIAFLSSSFLWNCIIKKDQYILALRFKSFSILYKKCLETYLNKFPIFSIKQEILSISAHSYLSKAIHCLNRIVQILVFIQLLSCILSRQKVLVLKSIFLMLLGILSKLLLRDRR